MSLAFDVFRRAVAEKKQIVCIFQGYSRQICPHVLGYKKGKEHVLAYQFAPPGPSGKSPGGTWQCLEIPSVWDVKIRDGEWYTGPAESRPQECIDEIVVEVAA